MLRVLVQTREREREREGRGGRELPIFGIRVSAAEKLRRLIGHQLLVTRYLVEIAPLLCCRTKNGRGKGRRHKYEMPNKRSGISRDIFEIFGAYLMLITFSKRYLFFY
jgi:hypothetical protein